MPEVLARTWRKWWSLGVAGPALLELLPEGGQSCLREGRKGLRVVARQAPEQTKFAVLALGLFRGCPTKWSVLRSLARGHAACLHPPSLQLLLCASCPSLLHQDGF
jgi:hypothetical protein